MTAERAVSVDCIVAIGTAIAILKVALVMQR